MTPQNKILIGYSYYFDDENYLCMNLFWGADQDYINDHQQQAKEVYKYIFKEFLTTSIYFYFKTKDISFIPLKEWEEYAN